MKGRERTCFDHFWNDFAAGRKRSIPETDRKLHAAAYAREGRMAAGCEALRAFEGDAAPFATFARTPLTMPMLVLTGEQASGQVLIDQAKLVDTKFEGVIVPGAGHWLMEEASQLLIPKLADFLKREGLGA